MLNLGQDGILVLPQTSTTSSGEEGLVPIEGVDMSPASSAASPPPLDMEHVGRRPGEFSGCTASQDTMVDHEPARAARGIVEKEAGAKEGMEARGLLERQRTERVSALTELVVNTAGEVLRVRFSSRG